MQLTAVIAQPPIAEPAGPSRFLSILTTLRGPRPPASAAAAPPAASALTAPATSVSAAVEASQPSLGQKLLGGVATSQNKYLANQQMLAVISAGLGARFSMIAKSVWSQLKGSEPQAATQPSPQVEAPPAG